MLDTILIIIVYILAWAGLSHLLSGGMVWKSKEMFTNYIVFTLLVAIFLFVVSCGEIYGIKM